MAGTSQMLDIHRRDFSPEILEATGIPRRLFPTLVEAGDRIGSLRHDAARNWGFPPACRCSPPATIRSLRCLAPVLSRMNRCSPPVREILMVRSGEVNTALLSQYPGSTCELDSLAGLSNPGMQWLASGCWSGFVSCSGRPKRHGKR